MPPITRWFIKTALVYFVLALLVDLVIAFQGWLPFSLPALFPIYIHLLAEGWLTFLIIGVALWMFPKFSREQPRGSERLNWAAYGLLNAGLLLRIIAEPLNTANPGGVAGWVLVASAVLQWSGGMAFVVNAWPRVKEK